MLDGIRKAANNWLGRAVLIVIMSVLILSFAIWGIGDMLRVQGSTAVANVGGVEIGSEQMRRSYTSALEDLSQRARRRITNDEARAYGIDRQVLGRLISEAALDQRAKQMGLNLSAEDVARLTMIDPGFKGANGQFDRAKFYDVLRQNGLNEAAFFDEQKRSMLRRQIGSAVGGDAAPSQTLVDAAYRYVSEERNISYFPVSAASLGDIQPASDAALTEFYEGRKIDFRAPEYRKVIVLAALPDQLGLDLTVTDADLRRVYDRGLAAGQFGTPSKRQVRQILFPNESEAMAAALRVASGVPFETLLAEKNIKPEDADLGMKTRREFAEPAIADAAFETEKGAVSKPVKSGFGYALVKVEAIDPGTEVSFDIAKNSLGDAAKAEKLRSDPRIQAKLDEIQKKVEEAKIAGKSLIEAATGAGLTPRTVDALDATGKDKAAAKVALPGDDETLKAIFQSDIGLDNEALRLKQGGLVWFEIAGVESARDRAFAEVKPEVMLKWRADETVKRLAAKAADYVKRLDAGEDIAAVAKDAGSEVKAAKVTRQNGGDVGQTTAAQAFAVAVGKAASAALPGDAGRAVFKVLDAKVAPLDPTSGVALQLKKQIGEQLSEDLTTQYIQRVQTELGATINQKAFTSAIGGGGN